jgi:hypothetical protein
MGGGGGEVTVISDSSFRVVFDLVFLLIAKHPVAIKNYCLPPPRYLFAGCWKSESYAPNMSDLAHAPNLLGKIMHLGSTLKKLVVDSRAINFWVLDTCCMTNNHVADPKAEKMRALYALPVSCPSQR